MPSSYSFLSIINSDEIVITVIVHPRSGRKKAVFDQEEFHVYLVEAPEQGKANKALIKFLSKFFKLPSNCLSIISGTTSKIKRINIRAPKVADKVITVLQSYSHK